VTKCEIDKVSTLQWNQEERHQIA